MKLVIVSGPSASGKTTVAKEIAARLHYQYIGKDDIKEKLFDAKEKYKYRYLWHEKQAKKLFFERIHTQIRRNKSLVVESNFIKSDKQKILPSALPEATIYEVYCQAKGYIRLKRYIKRNESGERHTAHPDRLWYLTMGLETMLSSLGVAWPYLSVGISDKKMVVDTSDFSAVDYKKIIDFIAD